MLLINGAALILTLSRGSMLGLIVAAVIVLILKERHIPLAIVATVIGMVGLLTYTYPIWEASGRPTGIWAPEDGTIDPNETSYADPNTMDRALFLWPRATYLFLNSPIFGTGFGSYNDLPYHLSGMTNVLEFNRPLTLTFSSSHAHNTYLHVLAETGLVGFGLLVFLLCTMWKDIDCIRTPSVRLGLKIGFWMAVFSSLTEHRLFTPSEMLPFTILLGLALANSRSSAPEKNYLNAQELGDPEVAAALPQASSAHHG
jgi:O-antigen ligase